MKKQMKICAGVHFQLADYFDKRAKSSEEAISYYNETLRFDDQHERAHRASIRDQ